jgi:hypothetical protein
MSELLDATVVTRVCPVVTLKSGLAIDGGCR